MRVPAHSTRPDCGHDWLVATPDELWAAAIAKMKAAAEERRQRMAEWEETQAARGDPDYWERYDREKYRIPINYPMPVGHVCFRRK